MDSQVSITFGDVLHAEFSAFAKQIGNSGLAAALRRRATRCVEAAHAAGLVIDEVDGRISSAEMPSAAKARLGNERVMAEIAGLQCEIDKILRSAGASPGIRDEIRADALIVDKRTLEISLIHSRVQRMAGEKHFQLFSPLTPIVQIGATFTEMVITPSLLLATALVAITIAVGAIWRSTRFVIPISLLAMLTWPVLIVVSYYFWFVVAIVVPIAAVAVLRTSSADLSSPGRRVGWSELWHAKRMGAQLSWLFISWLSILLTGFLVLLGLIAGNGLLCLAITSVTAGTLVAIFSFSSRLAGHVLLAATVLAALASVLIQIAILIEI